jgi:hypothetical protein
MEATPASLRELFDRLSVDAACERVAEGEATEYRRGAQTFAVAEDEAIEVRLHPDIAEATRRTPSTGASSRGAEWARFTPPELDQHALDRAEAWFLSAWRAADTTKPRSR